MIFNKHFSKYYLRYLHMFLIGIGILIAIDYFQLEIPRYLGEIINVIDANTDPSTGGPFATLTYDGLAASVFPKLKAILIVLAVVAGGRVLWRFFIFGTSRLIEEKIRNEMFEHATKLSNSYYSREKVGGLMTYFINDLAAIRMAFGPGLLTLVDALFLGGFALARMFRLHVKLTLFALIPLVLLAISMFLIRKSMQRKFKARQQSFEDMSDFVQENVSGMSIIKAYVKEAASALRFRKRAEDFKEKEMSFIKTRVWFQISVTIAVQLVIITLIGFGGYLVIQNDLASGDLVQFVMLFGSMTWPVMALVRFLNITTQANASVQRLSRFLDEPIEINDDLAVPTPELGTSITAKNLTFAYPDEPDNPVLDNISFEIKEGERVGILGRTGSGKSTLVDLLLRVYNVDQGQLFISGRDIMTIPLKQLRDSVGYVPQDNFLFSDTIKANIGFAYDNPSDKLVVRAAQLSDVYSNITGFKEGFETVLGERGVTVSGGQKQRISIARALAKDPKILILDDSVSAVDTKTEEVIIRNLKQVRENKTTIFIAHRISTVRYMDKIIFLEKGKIADIGSHEELMERCELYQELVKLQTLEAFQKEGGDLDD